MHINNEPDFINKTSLDNYIYYNIIRKKNKFHKGIMIVFELFFLYVMAVTLASENGINGIIALLGLILLGLKNLYVVFKGKSTGIYVSLITDVFATILLMLRNLSDYKATDIIIDVIPIEIIVPMIYSYSVCFRNRILENALSVLPDYPYFKTELYKIGDNVEYTPFDDESKEDVLLKKNLIAVYTHNKSLISQIVRFSSVAIILMLIIIFLNGISEIRNIGKYDKYICGDIYSYSKVLQVDVDISNENPVCWMSENRIWVKLLNENKYISLTGDEKDLNSVSDSDIKSLIVKTVKADSHSFNYDVLSRPIFGIFASELSANQKEEIREIAVSNVCFKYINYERVQNKVIFSILGIILLVGVYMFSGAFEYKHFN